MAGFMDIIGSSIGKELLKGAIQKTGASESQASTVISMALPVILGAMNRNTNTREGADGLLSALKKDHDGSILDNIGGFLSGGNFSEGTGILKHVIGNRRNNVESTIGKQSGLEAGTVGTIMDMAAPLVMGYLGKKQRESNLTAGGLSGLLSAMKSETEYEAPEEVSLVEKILDSDGDGSIIDDVAGIGMKLLGGFLKK